MTQLKTLKDLNVTLDTKHYPDKKLTNLVPIYDLRQEAIKWIEEFQNRIEKHSHKSFKVDEPYLDCIQCRNYFVQIQWIKHFFNIKTFEEMFPSLENERFSHCEGDICKPIQEQSIQEHCLDKQKVKDAIEKYLNIYFKDLKPHKPTPDASYYLLKLKKELGL